MTQVSKQISVRILLPVILTCVASAIFAADQPTADLKSLYEGHHWFQLRDAIGKAEALPLYRGAVAAAFDQREEAEQYLGRVIAAAPASQKAAEARDILIAMQVRAGRYTQAAMNMTEQMESSSGKTAAHESGGMYDAIAKLPDMTVSYHGSPAQQYEMSDDRLSVPIVINGMRADFLLDTDSDISVISESEATRLGLPVTAGKVRVSGEAGDQENGGRIVVAKNLVTGNIEFNNVAFIVVPDGQEPFVELPAGKRGILGLPVLLGFRTLRWRPGGPIEIGFASAKEDLSRANLCFDKDDPVTLAEFQERKIDLLLDTGADESELWSPFAKEFSTVISEYGMKDSKTVTGYTGSKDVDVVTLPEVQIEIAGFHAKLRSAPVFMKVAANSGNRYFGRVGMDVLRQSQTVTIDFGAMTFTMK